MLLSCQYTAQLQPLFKKSGKRGKWHTLLFSALTLISSRTFGAAKDGPAAATTRDLLSAKIGLFARNFGGCGLKPFRDTTGRS